MNKRLPQQSLESFPIYGFTLIGSRRDRSIGPRRWRFLGLLEYLRHYPDTQVDTRGNARKVWLFEFRIHEKPNVVPVELDTNLSVKLIEQSRSLYPPQKDEREVVVLASLPNSEKKDAAVIEAARARLLASSPEEFEHFVKDLLARSGFDKAAVTRFSQDGGIDVNAYAGASMWPLQGTLIQIQAKRWLHTVGRKEVAELRGSLLPHARGALVTTSYFSKAALLEAAESGKLPIVLVDGNEVARLSLEFGSKT
jgi:restriction endonuclease Mrr